MPSKSSGTSGSKQSGSKAGAAKPATKPSAKPANNVRHVVPDKKAGDWKVSEPKKAAPTAAAPTQKKAEVLAKQQVKSAGGGEVRIHSRDGKIRDSDTVKPGNESKIKDKKH
ncbi:MULTISPECIES: DUF2188 domain-containing protein [Micrococcaceae]|jgi:hypothetical protein|uniref:DUF2188 domain-containing protein n=1 Tax=Arthrobacter sp. J3.49 TaxID=347213 RepID=I3W1M0_9MICC|nr:DUF2188 domain-containing protein [Arthrobacter sp. J3.49]AFK89497.1 hypothetical protein [Arthrobacter sp. J3.49]